MLVSDVLGTPRSILNDPTKIFWSDAELIGYLTAFLFDACGKRRDLFSVRVSAYALVSGVYQPFVPPSGAVDCTELLEVYTANAGPVAFLTDYDDIKHSNFSGLANATAVAAVKGISYDPRDRKGFRCFPPSTGSGSTIDCLLACVPAAVAALSDTYPLEADTVWAAQQFVIGSAFDKNNERRDTLKSEQYMGRYQAWLTGNWQSQVGQAGTPD